MSIIMDCTPPALEELSKKQLIHIIRNMGRKRVKKGVRKETIPVGVFVRQLAPLEAVCKYLHEEGHRYAEIARLTNRDVRTIWATMQRAQQKMKKKFLIKRTYLPIPIDIIRNRKLSVLEGMVAYLKEQKGLTLHQIAVLLHRNDRTIWTVYARSRRKRG